MPIPQSNVIFFYLFAAFFVFITMRGELRRYMGFLLSSPTPAPAPIPTSGLTQQGNTTDKLGQVQGGGQMSSADFLKIAAAFA